jgi:WD repeat and SOF domain-containing protein 1
LAQNNNSNKKRSGTGGGSKATQKVARDETGEKVTRDEEEEKWTQWAKEAEEVEDDVRDLSWSTVLKRTFEGYLRGESPNMYGEWLDWGE